MLPPSDPLFTIAVCTYDRPNSLQRLLHSMTILPQENIDFEVLIINNFPELQLEDVLDVDPVLKKYTRIVDEPQAGLSNARNRAVQESRATWVIFLDDDTSLLDSFLLPAKRFIERFDVAGFGGRAVAAYAAGRPKWFPRYFETLSLDQVEAGVWDGYFFGSLMAFRRDIIVHFPFDTSLGMSGKQMAYGEDTEIQRQLRMAGYTLGIDPNWEVQHWVPSYKMSWEYQRESAMARGRAAQQMQKRSKSEIEKEFLHQKRYNTYVVPLLNVRDYLLNKSEEIKMRNLISKQNLFFIEGELEVIAQGA